MEAAQALLVTSAPWVQVNQPVPAAQINQQHGSHAEDRKRLPYYNSKAAVATGIIQISCGVLAIVVEICFLTSVPYLYPHDKVSVGIWGGALFSVTGVLGIFSSKKKRGMVIVYFILSIVSSVTALVGILFAFGHILSGRWYGDITLVFSVFSLIVNIIEVLTAIVASSFGCAARMCCDGQPIIQERVVYVAPQGSTQAYNGFHFPVGLPPPYESNLRVQEKH